MPLNTSEEIIEDIRQGRMVVLMDDEDRENEGDLLMAASCVRADDINFMARYGRGLICMTLTPSRCKQLRLPLMVSGTDANHETNFTVSIEAAKGVTTGISAADRATTILAAVAENAKPEDIIQPGHIFPLMAQQGGVLTRAGHTEAGSDLARLAGFEASSVIVEILNEDGSMARRQDLEGFADKHQLKIGTIADLIRYRLENDQTVERVTEAELNTRYGNYRLVAYRDMVDDALHVALVKGTIDADEPILVRVHMQDTLFDILEPPQEDGSLPLHVAMERVAKEDTAVVVILRKPENHAATIRKIEGFQNKADEKSGDYQSVGGELRTYGVGAQILHDLGVRRMRILGAPRKMRGISGFDLTIDEYVSSNS